MKVRLRTMRAGPQGVYHPGDVIDVPQHEAELLINTQAAIAYVEPNYQAATLAGGENASLDRKPVKRIGRPRKVSNGPETDRSAD